MCPFSTITSRHRMAARTRQGLGNGRPIAVNARLRRKDKIFRRTGAAPEWVGSQFDFGPVLVQLDRAFWSLAPPAATEGSAILAFGLDTKGVEACLVRGG